MKLWIDDLRPAPSGYFWCKSVDGAISLINNNELNIEEINLDHDAGFMVECGGDYIEILKEMEIKKYFFNTQYNFLIKFHSANPVGVQNMKRICEANGWRYE